MSLYPQESEFLDDRNCVLIIPAPSVPTDLALQNSWPILMEQESNSMINIKSVLCAWQLGASHVPCHFTILNGMGPLSTLHRALCTQNSDYKCPPIPGSTFHSNPATLDLCSSAHFEPGLTSLPGPFRWDPGWDTLPISLWLSTSALSSAVCILNLFQHRG